MPTLDTYVGTPRNVEIGDKTVAVSPLRMRQLPAFAKAIAPVAGMLAAGQLLMAMSVAGDELIEAVAIATGQDRAWLGDLLPDDFVRLAAVVMEVNTDFFVRRVAPTVTEAATSMTKALTAGETPSPSSSPTGTA